MTGTTPFLSESDDEIVDKVATGLRPEWPSGNPPQGLSDAVWEQVKTCWKQELKERPTASDVLETLVALGETYHHGPVVSAGDAEEEAMAKGWEYIEDGPEEGAFVGFGVIPRLTFSGLQPFRRTKNAKGTTKNTTV